jgi:hypothetical protein
VSPSAPATPTAVCRRARRVAGRLGDDRALRFSAAAHAPFAIEVISTLDRDDPTYVLDVVSVVESVLDDPRPCCTHSEYVGQGREVARLKSEGVPYEERMDVLDNVTWPKPLEELIDTCFADLPRAPPVDRAEAVAQVDPARDAGER